MQRVLKHHQIEALAEIPLLLKAMMKAYMFELRQITPPVTPIRRALRHHVVAVLTHKNLAARYKLPH